MSVLETVKEAIGVGESGRPTYRCLDCGEEFQTTSEQGSHWFECPECGSADAERLDEE